MSAINRRDFIKAASSMVGAAALAGVTPALAAPSEGKGPSVSASTRSYEIYAVKYAGPFDRKLAMALFNTGWNEEIQINFYTWVLRDKDGGTVLVDTGTGPTLARERNIKNFIPPETLIARLGVKPEQVSKVILTHMHYDHVGGMEVFPELYPKATFYVQKREYDFWLNDPISRRAPYKGLSSSIGNARMEEMLKSKRLVLVDGDKAVAPGMALLLTPGHTTGLQGVLVQTEKGPAVVASDSAHLARSYKDDVPSCLITDLPAWLKSYDKLRAKAALENIFPGHDALMASAYPAVAEGVTRLA